MSGQTITRRRAPRQSAYPVGRFWLRFVARGSGEHLLTVDPDRCPHSIHAANHWRPDADGVPVFDEFHGEMVVLGVCLCEP